MFLNEKKTHLKRLFLFFSFWKRMQFKKSHILDVIANYSNSF